MSRRKWSDEEIKEYRKTHSVFFYFNKKDSNIFVPKTYGFGMATNWANPISWIFVLVIIGIIFFQGYFK